MTDFDAFLAAARPEHSTGGRHPVSFWLLIILALGLLAVSVSYFDPGVVVPVEPSATPTPTERPARVYTVTYKFGVFSPTNLRIHLGDTVIFRNEGTRDIRIAAQLDPRTKRPEFDSGGPVPPDSSFSFTFAEAGIFEYAIVGNTDEAGTIIVR